MQALQEPRTLETLKAKRFVFVSGKGGVGKSLIAAAVAKMLAREGRKILLVELGETSYYRDFWNLPTVSHVPQAHPDGFDLALWSGETALREYVLHYLRMERLYKLFFENKVMRALVNVAPGLAEIAILGKITSGLRKVGPPLEYDTVVVDTFATGHALALFQTPRAMNEAVQIGPMGHHSREIDRVLRDPKLTSYIVVTLLEDLPVGESLEFRDGLRRAVGLEPIAVANKVLQPPVSTAELQEVANEEKGENHEFADYLLGALARQRRHFETLTQTFSNIVQVPMIFSESAEELVSQTEEALRTRSIVS